MESCTHEFIKPNDAIDINLEYSIDEGGVVPKHFHDWIEIVYLVKGTLEVHDSSRMITLQENDFVIINPMSIHSTRCIGGNQAILLQIPVSFIKKYMPEVVHYHFSTDPGAEDETIQAKLARIRFLLQDLLFAYENKEEGYVFHCYSLVFELLYICIHSFSRRIDEANLVKSQKNQLRMRQIMDYVNAHYQEEVMLHDIAAAVGLNQVYFSRFFKQQTGITFLEYLNTVRMERFHNELLHTDYCIKDLLEKNHFYNYKLFMRMFKNAYGCTPKELRKRISSGSTGTGRF